MGSESQLFQRFGRVVPSGTLLFHENDPGEEMFIIQTGKVKISKKVRNVEKTLVVLGKGEFFGEMAILNDRPRSATAEVVEDSEILVIDRKTFETMIRGNAEIALRIIKKLSARLQEADNQIENLMIRDNTSRIVDLLAKLARDAGKHTGRGVELDYTFDDLAGMVGLGREQVVGILDKLVKIQVIELSGGAIVISNKEQLDRFMRYMEMREMFGEFS
ncbi:MAG: Crp/Fnr family transcriptional regulator [Nitrospirota bacterium]